MEDNLQDRNFKRVTGVTGFDYYAPIPDRNLSFEELFKQMRINVDILKQEITEHIDKELDRFQRRIEEVKYMNEPDLFK